MPFVHSVSHSSNFPFFAKKNEEKSGGEVAHPRFPSTQSRSLRPQWFNGWSLSMWYGIFNGHISCSFWRLQLNRHFQCAFWHGFVELPLLHVQGCIFYWVAAGLRKTSIFGLEHPSLTFNSVHLTHNFTKKAELTPRWMSFFDVETM